MTTRRCGSWLNFGRAIPFASGLLALQAADGSWTKADSIGLGHSDRIHATAPRCSAWATWASARPDEAVPKRGADWLFGRQRKDGTWPLPRADDDGESAGRAIRSSRSRRRCRSAGWRRAATQRTRAPSAATNGCWRSVCRTAPGPPVSLPATPATWPAIGGWRIRAGAAARTPPARSPAWRCTRTRRASAEARRGLDLLLGRETREAAVLGYEVARIIGAELAHGFMTTFARFDLAQLLDLCWRIGATADDPRVAELVDFVSELQGPYGLWEYMRPAAGLALGHVRSAALTPPAQGGRTGGVDRPGAAHAVPDLSAAQKALLIRYSRESSPSISCAVSSRSPRRRSWPPAPATSRRGSRPGSSGGGSHSAVQPEALTQGAPNLPLC